ncbi:MAG: YihY/virulence factor BrkB family protein [Hyphomonas sp.]|uniref:hypothetical protein n=1 Tax=Hyphomonas sp. TaxID=87 RepID=UPI0017E48F59|nr:hypothetical protein [Hyphomonas sp.]MBA3070358.1 YihY/virulence factor BrkB family protein [Hyphomonas sp.]MBU3919097.1 hypothetical protein [Alphaproteobacteria bacterium]MBU4062845.1 hypothetical protein [Alphaproteobacteria bacterium]MBU4163764.1 hypothetical protein [Alphaproteobacteria bacterium]
MSDERRLKEIRDVARLLDLDEEVSQDVSDVRTPCPLHADCIASGDNNLHLNLQTASYACVATGEAGRLGELIRQVEAGRSLVPVRTADDEAPPSEVMDASYSVAIRATNPVLRTEPQVTLLTEKLPSPEEIKAAREIRLEEIRAAQAERRRGAGEKLIVVGLALVFVIAGLMAAGLSGFANYQAFASTVADPAQGRIWGAAGIIAAIVSFGGFTFVYWHAANRRRGESLRSLVFALIGAGASILGTEIYIHSNNLSAAAEVTSAATNRDVLQAQVADWRRQLDGIPPETRSVEGLEAYIAEVERVGRTEQKPYRDAQNELGLAKRRDELNAKIEAANAELLGQGSGNILLQAEQRAALPSWLFAVLLELFSSQATSIGLVALLILARRGTDQSASG